MYICRFNVSLDGSEFGSLLCHYFVLGHYYSFSVNYLLSLFLTSFEKFEQFFSCLMLVYSFLKLYKHI